MSTKEREMNIFEKMSKISMEIGEIEKSLDIDQGKKSYKALSNDDVLSAIKPIEEKYGVFSYPCDSTIERSFLEKSFTDEYTHEQRTYQVVCDLVKVTYRFVNVDNPSETIEIKSFGTGIDSGDKSTGKGMTYANKYALISAYKIIGGQTDPDIEASPLPSQGYNNPMYHAQSRDGEESKVPTPKAEKPEAKAEEKPVAKTEEKIEEKKVETKAEEVKPQVVSVPTTLEEAESLICQLGSYANNPKSFKEIYAENPSRIEFFARKFNKEGYEHYVAAAKLIMAAHAA